MEFYLDYITPLLEHFQEYWSYYAVGGPILAVAIFLTRRYSLPAILYTVEFVAYVSVLHSAIHLAVRLAAWFKNSSSMQAVRPDGLPADAVHWTTPWPRFWELEYYDPSWIVWVEAVLAVMILGIMIRYRPMKVQYKRTYRYKEPPEDIKRALESSAIGKRGTWFDSGVKRKK